MVRHTGEDLIGVERITMVPALSFQKKGIDCSELDAPEADGLACNDDTPLCEQVFDISVARAASVAELGSITNDIGWKTKRL
nr:hypothetical protein [Candidatus Marimicrobium litorale]